MELEMNNKAQSTIRGFLISLVLISLFAAFFFSFERTEVNTMAMKGIKSVGITGMAVEDVSEDYDLGTYEGRKQWAIDNTAKGASPAIVTDDEGKVHYFVDGEETDKAVYNKRVGEIKKEEKTPKLKLKYKEGTADADKIKVPEDIDKLYYKDIDKYMKKKELFRSKTYTLENCKNGVCDIGDSGRKIKAQGNELVIMDSSDNAIETFVELGDGIGYSYEGEKEPEGTDSIRYNVGGRIVYGDKEDSSNIEYLSGNRGIKIGEVIYFSEFESEDGKITLSQLRIEKDEDGTVRGYGPGFKLVYYKGKDGREYEVKYDRGKVSNYDELSDEAQRAVTASRIGTALEAMVSSAAGARVWSNIFGWDKGEWAKEMNEFFESTVFGRVISGRWEESVCSHYIAKSAEGVTMILEEDGKPNVGVYVGGTRTEISYINETTQQGKKKYLYKLEWVIVCPEEKYEVDYEENEYNIKLEGQREIDVYKKDQEIEEGDSVEKTGSSALITYSDYYYDEICVEFDEPYKLATGERKKEICNNINEYDEGPTDYESEEEEAGETEEEDGMNEI